MAILFEQINLPRRDYYRISEPKPKTLRDYLMPVLLFFAQIVGHVHSLNLGPLMILHITWFVDCYTIQLMYYLGRWPIDLFSHLIFGQTPSWGV